MLDNIVLVQETLHWAKTSNQPTTFLTLDFSKLHDKESWQFLFETMHRLGMHKTFIKWIKMFFGKALASMNLNGSPCKEFKVKRGAK